MCFLRNRSSYNFEISANELRSTGPTFILLFCTRVRNMFHDQHVLTNGMYFAIFFLYVLPRASYGYIWCGFIPSVVWTFSNYYFQLFRCRNLALNRMFLLINHRGRDGGFSYLGGICMHPYVQMLPICLDGPIHLDAPDIPPYVQTHPCMSPMLLCASVCSKGIFMCYGDAGAHHMFGHSPYAWTPPQCPTPDISVCSPVCLCSRGYLHVPNPYVWGFGGESAHLSGCWCLSVHPMDVHYASSCTVCVVYYVTSL